MGEREKEREREREIGEREERERERRREERFTGVRHAHRPLSLFALTLTEFCKSALAASVCPAVRPGGTERYQERQRERGERAEREQRERERERENERGGEITERKQRRGVQNHIDDRPQ
jgi:hypothetical protein